jgi:hypothetical protein
MANVVRDPKVHPDAVLGDFAHPEPVRTFTLEQVAFVYGSRSKQRYFEKRGRDYYPLLAQWDIQHRQWLPYHVPDGADYIDKTNAWPQRTCAPGPAPVHGASRTENPRLTRHPEPNRRWSEEPTRCPISLSWNMG